MQQTTGSLDKSTDNITVHTLELDQQNSSNFGDVTRESNYVQIKNATDPIIAKLDRLFALTK